MHIGITERGDAGIDLSWYDKLSGVSGAVLITKKLTNKFCELSLATPKPVIVHCTCTGWGGSWLEPNTWDYRLQLYQLLQLLDCGFPKQNVVLRIDPIFPTEEGLGRVRSVLEAVKDMQLPIERVRVSIYDEYGHVRNRIYHSGHSDFYGGSFSAPKHMQERVTEVLTEYPYIFETCAEDISAFNIIHRGCISLRDFEVLGIDKELAPTQENPQNRKGCHCLACKKELLTNKTQCPLGCLYCYWR